MTHCKALTGLLGLVSVFQGVSTLPHHVRQDGEEFEYIVVGSGPGGGPLAANLARHGHSVLLLEAGGDYGDTDLQQVPF